MRQKGLGAVHHTPEIDVHDPFHVLELGILDVAVMRDAGIVVHLVHHAEVRNDVVGVSQHLVTLSDVEPVGLHLHPKHLHRAHRLLETIGVDVGERQLRALRREIERQRPTDTRTRAGDDRDLAFERTHIAASFSVMRARSRAPMSLIASSASARTPACR